MAIILHCNLMIRMIRMPFQSGQHFNFFRAQKVAGRATKKI